MASSGSQPTRRPIQGTRKRLGSGIVVVAEPRGAPGLEIGLARFIHRPWGDFSANALSRPFSGVIITNTNGSLNQAAENQTASIFARWAVPRAKSEFYGEFYKEDYPGGFHQAAGNLVEQPDDLASFALGFQRLLISDARVIRVLRGELVNGQSSHQERLERGFTSPDPPYIHGVELQGHTLNGLILGSPEAYGGAAWRLGIDEFTSRGRRSVSLERSLRLDWLPTEPAAAAGVVHPDVIYAIRAEVLSFRGPRTVGVTLIPAVDLNRNLVAHHDVLNVTAAVSMRGW